MKRLWLTVGITAAVAAIAAFVLMSGTAEAPGSQEEAQSPDAGTVTFEYVDKEPERREESDVEFDGRLLSVYAGVKPTGGYGIEIEKLVETDYRLQVYVNEIEPGESCMATQALTYPQATVRLSRQINKPVDIITNRIVQEC